MIRHDLGEEVCGLSRKRNKKVIERRRPGALREYLKLRRFSMGESSGREHRRAGMERQAASSRDAACPVPLLSLSCVDENGSGFQPSPLSGTCFLV